VQQKGIMFDMDNTLLQSRIDFRTMRTDLIKLLVERKYGTMELFEQSQTPAEVIELARQLKAENDLIDLDGELWEIVARHEERGMCDVELEEGAYDLLQRLRDRNVLLTVVTNNAVHSAIQALERTEISPCFSLIVGREQMQALKPSPSGVHLVKQRFKTIKDWLLIGDSWIDGYAAQQGGVPFVAYQAEVGIMEKNDVYPIKYVHHYTELNNWLFDHWLSG
jgi:phosphoglycolate phosphatase